MRIAVVGAGAIGAVYGARFAEGGADVTLVARGERLAALRDRGVTVETADRTTRHQLRATDDVASIGAVDVVLVCVKSYDTEAAAAGLAPLLHDGTAVVSLQNGVENEDVIAAAVGLDHVVGGSAYILASVREPGVVRSGGPGRIVIGEWRGGPASERVRSIVEAARRGGIDADAVDDIRVAKWEKFTLLAAFSAMSAAVRLGLGEIAASLPAREMLRHLMVETWSVGRAAGVALPDDLVERQLDLLLGQVAGANASLYQDLVAGRRMETEALQGSVVRLGRSHGVPTPWMAAVYAILDPWTRRNATPPGDRAPVPAA